MRKKYNATIKFIEGEKVVYSKTKFFPTMKRLNAYKQVLRESLKGSKTSVKFDIQVIEKV